MTTYFSTLGDNDWLFGTGDGGDVAVFAGNAADYELSVRSGGNWNTFLVKDLNPADGDDGWDTVRDIETLRFADRDLGVAFQAGGIDGDCQRVITTLFDSVPVNSTVTALADGGFVLVWQSDWQNGTGYDIYGQRYGANGDPASGEFRLNSRLTGDQTVPVLAAQPHSDGFVAVWVSAGDIYARCFDSGSTPLAADFRVNSTTYATQTAPAVANLEPLGYGAGFVIAWQSASQDGDGYGIYAQRYSMMGELEGTEFRVNSTTAAHQSAPAVAATPEGFVVVWASAGQDGSGTGIYAQTYDRQGNPLGGEFQVNGTTTGNQLAPAVAGTQDGFVVVWEADGQAGGASGIYGQCYGSGGIVVGSEFQVDWGYSPAHTPAVSTIAGGFAVTWVADDQALDGSGANTLLRTFNSQGSPNDSPMRLDYFDQLDQSAPAVAGLLDGGLVVSYQSDNPYFATESGVPTDIVAERLPGNVGRVMGTEGNDTFVFRLDSQPAEILGGAGDDTYRVGPNALVSEANNAGVDTIEADLYSLASPGYSAYYLPQAQGDAGDWSNYLLSPRSYTLPANVERLVLTGHRYELYDDLGNPSGHEFWGNAGGVGNALDNTLIGNAWANRLLGGLGNDVLDGGRGDDTLAGGQGNDTYVVDGSTDIISESVAEGTDTVMASTSWWLGLNVENLLLTGSEALTGVGNTLANSLTGNGGDNGLDGGTGADTMAGGQGDDSYWVENAGDVVSERSLEGEDTVYASRNYILGDYLENLVLGGAAVSGTGNNLDNSLTGTDAANVLDGMAGIDTMAGGLGDDTYGVNDAGDLVIENAGEGTDTVSARISYTLATHLENLVLAGPATNGNGNDLANSLVGNFGNNLLDGKAGADTMAGGLGNDSYVVDSAGDVVSEAAGAGTDTVNVGFDYTLGANLEKLILTGTNAVSGTGNELANGLTGNAGNNLLDGKTGADVMTGGLGNDSYVVDNAADTTIEYSALTSEIDTVLASLSWTLATRIENLVLTGSDAVNGIGNTLANRLTGNGAANLLDGKTGADTLAGGLGNDTYGVDNSGDLITENADEGIDTVRASASHTLAANLENLVLTGTTALNGTGNALANSLTGNAGNNLLDGKAGADAMAGGLGNDSYVLDSVDDGVSENAAAGNDTVNVGFAYSLGTNLENLVLTGASAISGTGNELTNSLTGNAGNNLLDGRAGADSMTGGLGNDTYVVDNAADATVETSTLLSEIDTVLSALSWTLAARVENLVLTGSDAVNGIGNTSANNLTGNAGNNLIDGKAGADTMAGGLGNDSYGVDNAADVVTEMAGEGTDTVSASISYSLGAHLEKLILAGTTAINGTGNELANGLTGNNGNNLLDGQAGADTMAGGLGKDTYVVDDLADAIVEDSAATTDIDTVQSSLPWTLGSNLENLVLTGDGALAGTGNELANRLTGNIGDNRLDGGAGADIMIGGLGNDTYVIDNSGDFIAETSALATEIDTVVSSVTWTLGSNQEVLVLTGAAGINGTGSTLANRLTGNGQPNLLDGRAGNDYLDGGAGNDMLTGGGGLDVFVFNSPLDAASNVDLITDFARVAGNTDRIYLGSDAFAALQGSEGQLPAGAFTSAGAALEADDRIVYDQASGALYYDADGSGDLAAIQFAEVGAASHPALSAADFYVTAALL